MSSIATFNLCLETEDSSTEQQNLESVLGFANGIENEEGEKISSANSKDWRERLIDNLPYSVEDTTMVNLPAKLIEKDISTMRMSSHQVKLAFDDVKGNIFVYAGFLKPGRH